MASDLDALTITTAELCRLLDLTPARISQLRAAGIVVKRGRSSFALLESVLGYCRFLRDSGASAGLDFREQRARLTKLQGDKLEAELAAFRGKMIAIDAAVAPVAECLNVVRQRLLALAPRCAQQVVGQDARGAFAILQAEIVAILTELSSDADLQAKADEVAAREAEK